LFRGAEVVGHRERAVPPGSAALRGELLSEVEVVVRERRAPVACGRSLEAMKDCGGLGPIRVQSSFAGAHASGRRRYLVAGVGVFALAGSAAVAQLALGRTPPWAAAASGSVALSAGMVLIVIASSTDSSVVYLTGAIIGGAGFGVAFLGALRALSAVIPPSTVPR
jgi:hypothetical protein